MKKWLRGIRGAFVLGLIWALVWAPVAVLMGTIIIDPDDSMDEMWFVVGAYPGFLCGVIFSAALAIAEGHRLDELSLSRAGVWGAFAGVLVGLFPFIVATFSPEGPPWVGVAILGAVTLLSALSAVGAAMLARLAKKRELRDVART